MKRLSWKYIAGLIDGEACIDFQSHVDKRNKDKRMYIVPRMRIAMTEPALGLLELLQNNFGGNLWEAKRANKNSAWANAYYWQIQGKKMRALLQNIVKHLILKKEQARFAIWWIDNVMGKRPNKLTPEMQSIRKRARDEMKAMKRDPQRLSETAVQEFKRLGYGIWSPYSNACLGCGSTKKKHEARGYCKICYQRERLKGTFKNSIDATVQASI